MMNSFDLSLDRSNPCCLSEVICPLCQSYLEIHLPDPYLPERQLGTCPHCKSWFVMSIEAGRMWLIPDLGADAATVEQEIHGEAHGPLLGPSKNGEVGG